MNLIKCRHCYYLDYLDEEPKTCPKCGSPMQKFEDPFKGEKIIVKITTTRNRKTKNAIEFKNLSTVADAILGTSLKSVIPDKNARARVTFMIKAYTWTLLKIQPQLWLYIDIVINGIRELMTLRINKGAF